MILKVNATRMELSRLKKEHSIAVSGHRLLKDKRDEMMRQFLNIKKSATELRSELENELTTVYKHFAFAAAAMGNKQFRTALLSSSSKYTLSIVNKNIMSVSLPAYTIKFEEYTPSYSEDFAVSDLEVGSKKLFAVSEKLVLLAELEHSIKKLSAELEKTRRHVNSLEYVTIPNYSETMHYIRMRIEENARSNTARLIKVKDMIIEENLAQKTAAAD